MKIRIFFKYFLVACICALTFVNCKKAADVSLDGTYKGSTVFDVGTPTSNEIYKISNSQITSPSCNCSDTYPLTNINTGTSQSTAAFTFTDSYGVSNGLITVTASNNCTIEVETVVKSTGKKHTGTFNRTRQ